MGPCHLSLFSSRNSIDEKQVSGVDTLCIEDTAPARKLLILIK